MTLDRSLRTDLAAMEKAGTLKTFRHITGPMDTEVTMAEKSGRVLVLSSNNYLGLSDHPEVIAAGQKGAGRIRCRHGVGALHLWHVFHSRRDRNGDRQAVAYGKGADLCFVLGGENAG